MTSYYCSIAIRTYLSYCLRDTAKILVENQKIFISHLYLMPLMKVTPSYFADQLIEKKSDMFSWFDRIQHDRQTVQHRLR